MSGDDLPIEVEENVHGHTNGTAHAAIAEHCAELTYLNIRDCWRLDPEALAAIAQRCVKLQIFKCKYDNLVTNDMLSAIASSCTANLREIDLHGVRDCERQLYRNQ